MKSKTKKFFLLAFSLITAALAISSCRTDEVDIPPLTGPSGARLFILMDASLDHIVIRAPGKPRESSRICAQLKNQQGQGVAGETIKFRIANKEGTEVNIGTLDRLTVGTDAGGFACVTYTAPNSAEQPVPTRIYIFAILVNPSYTFEVTGTHALDLESTPPPSGCVFNGPGAPEADFTANPSEGVVDQQVCFDAQATTDDGIIVAASWDFGDGGTASGLVACHTFTSDGLFNVTLTVQDEDKNCDTVTQVFTVGVGGAPTCDFTVSPNPVNTDTTVNFDASTSTDADGTIVSFHWDFGDNTPDKNGKEVTHVFTTEGSFTVTLTVTDNAGNVSTCTQDVTVASGLPTCEFTMDPNPADPNEEVTFDASASQDVAPGTIVAWDWNFDEDSDFGDAGADKSGEIVTQSFSTPGTIVIGLRVTDDDGNQVTCSDTLFIGTPPICSITAPASDQNICQGDALNFTSTGSDPDGGAVTFAWDFGDGGTAPTQNASHTFNTPGNLQVELTVTDDEGLTCVDTVGVNVTAAPTIGSVLPLGAEAGDVVTITGTGFVGVSSVEFNSDSGIDQAAVFNNPNSTTITATIPNGATDGQIRVTTTCGTVLSGAYNLTETVECLSQPVCENEAASPLTFTIQVTSGGVPITTHQQITIGLSTNAGTAGEVLLACDGSNLNDFLTLDGSNVVIANGASSNTVDVTLCDDDDDPGSGNCVSGTQENFDMILSLPAGVTSTDTVCDGEIGDSD